MASKSKPLWDTQEMQLSSSGCRIQEPINVWFGGDICLTSGLAEPSITWKTEEPSCVLQLSSGVVAVEWDGPCHAVPSLSCVFCSRCCGGVSEAGGSPGSCVSSINFLRPAFLVHFEASIQPTGSSKGAVSHGNLRAEVSVRVRARLLEKAWGTEAVVSFLPGLLTDSESGVHRSPGADLAPDLERA